MYTNTLLSIMHKYKDGKFALISLSTYRLELWFASLRYLCTGNNSQEQIKSIVDKILLMDHLRTKHNIKTTSSRGSSHCHTIIENFPKYDSNNYKQLAAEAEKLVLLLSCPKQLKKEKTRQNQSTKFLDIFGEILDFVEKMKWEKI